MEIYKKKCAVCGTSIDCILEAAHIIPWSISEHEERLDFKNGILLCANHHKMFDHGELTISDDYTVTFRDKYSDHSTLSESDRFLTTQWHGQKISLPKDEKFWPNSSYLSAHKRQFEYYSLMDKK